MEIGNSRWYLKKAARKSLALSAWASGSLALGERRATGSRLRVLTYHRFGDRPCDPLCVLPAVFEAQMRWLADARLAVSLADLEAFVAGERRLPDGAVLVTADDGFRSVYTHMLPVLEQYGIPAVAYITPGLICDGGAASAGACGAAGEPYLSWHEIEQLWRAGVRIGSHGLTHRSFGRMGPVDCREEACRSREILESRLGCRVASLAYPYGTRADFNHTTANVLAETGYTTAFTSQHGAITPGADPLNLPRIKIEGGEGLWMFRQLTRGALDGWCLVDRTLWRLQHSGR